MATKLTSNHMAVVSATMPVSAQLRPTNDKDAQVIAKLQHDLKEQRELSTRKKLDEERETALKVDLLSHPLPVVVHTQEAPIITQPPTEEAPIDPQSPIEETTIEPQEPSVELPIIPTAPAAPSSIPQHPELYLPQGADPDNPPQGAQAPQEQAPDAQHSSARRQQFGKLLLLALALFGIFYFLRKK